MFCKATRDLFGGPGPRLEEEPSLTQCCSCEAEISTALAVGKERARHPRAAPSMGHNMAKEGSEGGEIRWGWVWQGRRDWLHAGAWQHVVAAGFVKRHKKATSHGEKKRREN